MELITVGAPEYSQQRSGAVVSAAITLGSRSHRVRYSVSAGQVTTSADPFLAASMLAAMASAGALKISGPVSHRLLQTIPTIQDIFAVWNRRLKRVPLEAEAQGDPPMPRGAGVACFFSGGVDSWYTLLKHFDEITHLIYVHGFDVPLDNGPLRARVTTAIRSVAAELDKPLVEVETDLRTFSDQYVGWEFYHGPGLASVALLLAPEFRRVYIAATHAYSSLYPLGSHPLLDPLWSTERTEIVHDGCEATRVDKVERIASSEIALRTLRVCWENPGGAYNCGRCWKCLRTMVALRIVGTLDRCSSFDRPLDLTAVSHSMIETRGGRDYMEQNLQALLRKSLNDRPLEQALRDCLAGKYHRGLWRLARRASDRVHALQRLLRPETGRSQS